MFNKDIQQGIKILKVKQKTMSKTKEFKKIKLFKTKYFNG